MSANDSILTQRKKPYGSIDDDENDYDDKHLKLSNPIEGALHSFHSIDRVSIENRLREEETPEEKKRRKQRVTFETESKKTYLSSIREFFGNLIFSIIYVTSDTKKRFWGFLVGLITIGIVVFVVSILYNSILKAPLIFLKLSEDNVGDGDLLFTPKFTNTSTIPFVNHTDIELKTKGNPSLAGTSPRWAIFANIQNANDPHKNISGMLLIMDTEREEKIGLGRNWPYRPLGEGEVHVRDSLLRGIDVIPNRGKRVNIEIDFSTLIQAFSGSSEEISQGITPDNNDSFLNETQILRTIFEMSGFNFSQTYIVNITKVAEDLRVNIPPNLKPFIDRFGVLTITGEEAFEVFAAVFGGDLNNNSTRLTVGGEYSVIDSIDGNYGKYPSALGNVMIVDSNYIGKTIRKSLFENQLFRLFLQLTNNEERFKKSFDNLPINQYSLSLYGRLNNRFPVYLQSENERNAQLIDITNNIMNSIGMDYPVDYTLPLLSALDATKYISLFIDQIFVGVVVMLAILGIILIFALLLSNVEEKTYEYGMLRALGLRQYSLIQVITAQSLYFAVPAIIIGMTLAFIANIGVEYLLQYVLQTPYINLWFYWGAVVIPIALGILIPVISNIIPIRHALSRTLRDSLDIAHQTFNETTVKMIKLEELGLEPWQTGISILLVIIGFVVYYMIPYSFIFQDLPLFFSILNAILLGMLIGLCFVAVVLQPFFERIILNLILCGKERRLKTLISKNLTGHRKRSSKTFLMFTLSVSFIIFAGVVFSLQAVNIRASVEQLLGADIVVMVTNRNYHLPVDKLNQAIAIQNQRYAKVNGNVTNNGNNGPPIVDYTYQTFNMGRTPKFITGVRFSSLAFFPTRTVRVFGLQRNFLQVTENRYFLYSQIDDEFKYNITGGKPDVMQSLYDDAGKALVDGEIPGFTPSRIFSGMKLGLSENASLDFDPGSQYTQYIDLIASEAMSPSVSVNVKTPLQIKFSTRNPKTGRSSTIDFIGKARSLVYKMPGFFFSSLELTSLTGTPVLINLNAYKQIAQQAAQSVGADYDGSTPFEKLFIRLRDDANSTEIQDVINGLQASVSSDFTSIQNVRDIIASTGTATYALMAFFNVVAALAIILCFFMLALSFTANVRDNSWEFGVLRSIGLSVNALIRAYIYEALCLVVSAFFCGTIIGCVIAMTLTAQFNLFLEMPFQFDFPWYLFFSILGMALVVAVLGSYFPSRNLKKKEIALVLRGLE